SEDHGRKRGIGRLGVERGFEARSERAALALVVRELDELRPARMAGDELFQDLTAPVGRAVVDEDDRGVAAGGRMPALEPFEGGLKATGEVVAGKNEREFHRRRKPQATIARLHFKRFHWVGGLPAGRER